jgi:hypothetical protein
MSKVISLSQNKMLVFWIGVLTGAVIVGLMFSYQAVQQQALQDALLQNYFEQLFNPPSVIGPNNG